MVSCNSKTNLSACVDCLTGEVGIAILICVQTQSDPSGRKPLPPHSAGVEVGRRLYGCVDALQQVKSRLACMSFCPWTLNQRKLLLQMRSVASGSSSVWKGPYEVSS